MHSLLLSQSLKIFSPTADLSLDNFLIPVASSPVDTRPPEAKLACREVNRIHCIRASHLVPPFPKPG